MTTAHVAGVHRSADHTFSKPSVDSIRLLAGLGVEGDAHAGARVKHRSRVAKDPTQPNLRQVLLFPTELLDDLAIRGYEVAPGALGENITTTGLDIFDLPTGTVLRIGTDAIVVLTGLRNPCGQINGLQDGLLGELRTKVAGETVRRGGVMAVVVHGGDVGAGDPIAVSLPPGAPSRCRRSELPRPVRPAGQLEHRCGSPIARRRCRSQAGRAAVGAAASRGCRTAVPAHARSDR